MFGAVLGALANAAKGFGKDALGGIKSSLKDPNTWVGKPGAAPGTGEAGPGGGVQQPLDLTGGPKFEPQSYAPFDPRMPFTAGGAPAATDGVVGSVPFTPLGTGPKAPFFAPRQQPMPTLAPQSTLPAQALPQITPPPDLARKKKPEIMGALSDITL